MNSGLLDPVMVTGIFAPLAVTVSATGLLWKTGPHNAQLRSALPQSRSAWGAAMMSELGGISGRLDRWRFSLGCNHAALLLPRPEPRPVLGVLAVALPLLALPFLYVATAAIELTRARHTASRWSSPGAVTALRKLFVLLTIAGVVSGVLLGLAGRVRREPVCRLKILGIVSSVGMIGHFLTDMHFLAGGE